MNTLSTISNALERWLSDGFNQIGQIMIRRENEIFTLMHIDDFAVFADIAVSEPGELCDSDNTNNSNKSLAEYHDADAALEIARYDSSGKYRSLKSAPNLRRGWKIIVSEIEELQLALDFFYPAACGLWRDFQHHALHSTPFRETANRQSGMYAVVKKISNEQVAQLAGTFCDSRGHCLKTMLWKIDTDVPHSALPDSKFDPTANQTGAPNFAIPLLCAEACNLFVAEARAVVKKKSGEKSTPTSA